MRSVVLLAVALTLLGATVALDGSGAAAGAEARWIVTDLGSCPSYNCWATMAINERGQVVGTSGEIAFLWQKGKRISLGRLRGDTWSAAVAINERGQVVGWSGGRARGSRAFLWEHGRMRPLASLPGASDHKAVAINDRGQVAGWGWAYEGSPLPSSQAVLWERGAARLLAPLPGQAESEAMGINNSGWIMGTSSPGTHGGGWEAVVWRAGKVTPLGKLGALTSEPVDVNDRGQVVGYTSDPERLYLWEKGRMRVISKQGTDELAIDESGRVAGSFFLTNRMFVWEKGRMRLFDTGHFEAMNDRGQVVGSTNDSEGTPLLWEDEKQIKLPLLRGHRYGMALALNERNQIVGWSGNYDYEAKEEDVYKGHLVLWTLR